MDSVIQSFGPTHYIQYPGALDKVGREAAFLGKRAFLLAGETAWSKTGEKIVQSLCQNGITHDLHLFHGYCSQNNVEKIEDSAVTHEAQIIIGIGGGKVMDTAKSVADRLTLPCITVHTSVATCAADAQLCVWYDDNGACRPGMTAKEPCAALILDSSLIIKDCPVRLTASGIADALAKYPELDYNVSLFPLNGKNEAFEVAKTVAKRNFDFLITNSENALSDIRDGRLTNCCEDVLRSTMAMTGLASSLVAGVRQLAVAHMLYNAVATLYKRSRDTYYHGEIVSCGIILQLYANDYDSKTIEYVTSFLQSIGTPTCLSEIGIEPNEKNSNTILNYIFSNGFNDPIVQQRILSGFARIQH